MMNSSLSIEKSERDSHRKTTIPFCGGNALDYVSDTGNINNLQIALDHHEGETSGSSIDNINNYAKASVAKPLLDHPPGGFRLLLDTSEHCDVDACQKKDGDIDNAVHTGKALTRNEREKQNSVISFHSDMKPSCDANVLENSSGGTGERAMTNSYRNAFCSAITIIESKKDLDDAVNASQVSNKHRNSLATSVARPNEKKENSSGSVLGPDSVSGETFQTEICTMSSSTTDKDEIAISSHTLNPLNNVHVWDNIADTYGERDPTCNYSYSFQKNTLSGVIFDASKMPMTNIYSSTTSQTHPLNPLNNVHVWDNISDTYGERDPTCNYSYSFQKNTSSGVIFDASKIPMTNINSSTTSQTHPGLNSKFELDPAADHINLSHFLAHDTDYNQSSIFSGATAILDPTIVHRRNNRANYSNQISALDNDAKAAIKNNYKNAITNISALHIPNDDENVSDDLFVQADITTPTRNNYSNRIKSFTCCSDVVCDAIPALDPTQNSNQNSINALTDITHSYTFVDNMGSAGMKKTSTSMPTIDLPGGDRSDDINGLVAGRAERGVYSFSDGIDNINGLVVNAATCNDSNVFCCNVIDSIAGCDHINLDDLSNPTVPKNSTAGRCSNKRSSSGNDADNAAIGNEHSPPKSSNAHKVQIQPPRRDKPPLDNNAGAAQRGSRPPKRWNYGNSLPINARAARAAANEYISNTISLLDPTADFDNNNVTSSDNVVDNTAAAATKTTVRSNYNLSKPVITHQDQMKNRQDHHATVVDRSSPRRPSKRNYGNSLPTDFDATRCTANNFNDVFCCSDAVGDLKISFDHNTKTPTDFDVIGCTANNCTDVFCCAAAVGNLQICSVSDCKDNSRDDAESVDLPNVGAPRSTVFEKSNIMQEAIALLDPKIIDHTNRITSSNEMKALDDAYVDAISRTISSKDARQGPNFILKNMGDENPLDSNDGYTYRSRRHRFNNKTATCDCTDVLGTAISLIDPTSKKKKKKKYSNGTASDDFVFCC